VQKINNIKPKITRLVRILILEYLLCDSVCSSGFLIQGFDGRPVLRNQAATGHLMKELESDIDKKSALFLGLG
jgi:hypothetical protein